MGGGSNDRLRFSATIDGNDMFDKNNNWSFTDKLIKQGDGVLDDFSLLRLVTHSDTDVSAFKPETLAVALSLDAGWKSAINGCHKHNIQLLIGFAHAEQIPTARSKKFLSWLYDPKGPSNPTIQGWAQGLVKYCKRFPGMNGICFDIENVEAAGVPSDPAGRRAELDRRGKCWSDFYTTVADEFAKKKWIVAAFLKAKIADDRSISTLPNDEVRLHPYEMAKGHDNLILRPMAYEADATEAWHKAICDYAVGTVGANGQLTGGKCPPESFQLAVKVSSSRRTLPDGTKEKVYVGGKEVPELGIISPATDVPPRCRTIFRPHLVGVCLFPGAGSASWSNINAALQSNKAGAMKGWPKQGPLQRDPNQQSGGEFEPV